MAFHADWLRPDWTASGAAAVMTTRQGGVSAAPFDGMNIRHGVGDDAASVDRNRAVLAAAISADAGSAVQPVYLNQVHGTRVALLTAADALPGAAEHPADACVTTEHGIACTAQVADCLPVLFAAPGGVGAAHAGWRGLAAGVLEAALASLCHATGCAPGEVQVWLGACIGPRQFEVGADVLAAFGDIGEGAFVRRDPSFGADKWLADLPALAGERLRAAGAGIISGGTWCTVEAPSRFFSYRRNHVTGRMVACVWRRG